MLYKNRKIAPSCDSYWPILCQALYSMHKFIAFYSMHMPICLSFIEFYPKQCILFTVFNTPSSMCLVICFLVFASCSMSFVLDILYYAFCNMHLVSITFFYGYQSVHLVLYIQVFTSFPMHLSPCIGSMHPVIFISLYAYYYLHLKLCI